jgi:hypothetical protein
MKQQPDINDVLREGGPDAVRARHDTARKYNGSYGHHNTTRPSGAPTEKKQPRFVLTPFGKIEWAGTTEYLIKNILPLTGLVLVYGAPKCGKSFWAFDIAMHVARGHDYRGKRVRGGPVVYLAAEGGAGFKKRVEAYRQRNDCPEASFHLCTVRPDLAADAPTLIADVRTQLDMKPPRAIFVDTVNRTLVGSENRPEDMAKYLRAAAALEDEFKCCVVLIHHCGIEAGRPRGHTSLTAAVDVQIAVERGQGGCIIVTIELMKDGASGEQIVSRLEQVEVGEDEDGDMVTSCVIVPVDGVPPKKSKRLSAQTELARRALADVIADHGEQNPNIPAGLRGAHVADWRDACYRRGIGGQAQSAKRQAFNRAKDTLAVRGIIGEQNDWAWLAQVAD